MPIWRLVYNPRSPGCPNTPRFWYEFAQNAPKRTYSNHGRNHRGGRGGLFEQADLSPPHKLKPRLQLQSVRFTQQLKLFEVYFQHINIEKFLVWLDRVTGRLREELNRLDKLCWARNLVYWRTNFRLQNPVKLTYVHMKFQKIFGGYTPGPPSKGEIVWTGRAIGREGERGTEGGWEWNLQGSACLCFPFTPLERREWEETGKGVKEYVCC